MSVITLNDVTEANLGSQLEDLYRHKKTSLFIVNGVTYGTDILFKALKAMKVSSFDAVHEEVEKIGECGSPRTFYQIKVSFKGGYFCIHPESERAWAQAVIKGNRFKNRVWQRWALERGLHRLPDGGRKRWYYSKHFLEATGYTSVADIERQRIVKIIDKAEAKQQKRGKS